MCINKAESVVEYVKLISFSYYPEGEGPEYSYTEEKEHEAGYDSYITGVCLVGLAKDLNINISEISPKNAHIRNFLNK